MKKIKRIIAILIIAVMLLGVFSHPVNADIEFAESDLKKMIDVDDINSTKFMPYILLSVYVDHTVTYNEELLSHFFADIEKDKTNLNEKGIILSSVGKKDGEISAEDPQNILSIAFAKYDIKDGNYVCEMLKDDIIKGNEEFDLEDIEIKTTIEIPDSLVEIANSRLETKLDNKIFDNSNSITISSKDSDINSKIESITAKLENFAVKLVGENANKNDKGYATISVKAIAKIENDTITYTLTLGKDFNWYLVPDKKPSKDEPQKEFSTEIKYVAKIDEKDVGQNTKYKEENKIDSSVFCPGFDEKQPTKDADVTVTINSKTDLPILKTNEVALTDDGKPNSEGWYYIDVKNKKVIAKLYKFDDYDNLKDNGIVIENVKLTSEEDLTDEQKVDITWPFRIIDVKYDPTEITEKTDKVTVTITTNLPMDKDKVPEEWAFTTDDEGKTQHRIFKIYEKKDGKNIDETITVKQNGTDVTAKTPVKIVWKEVLSPIIPQTGATLIIEGVLVILTICGVVAFKKYKK